MIGAMILQFQFYGVQMLGRLQDVRGHDLDGIRIPRFCPGLQRSFVFLLEFPFLNANRSKRAHTYWMRAAIIGFGTLYCSHSNRDRAGFEYATVGQTASGNTCIERVSKEPRTHSDQVCKQTILIAGKPSFTQCSTFSVLTAAGAIPEF